MSIDYRWVQTRLNALGFNPGPIDGVRGPRTDAAVVAFKKSIGFRARPYIGPLTLEALQPVSGVLDPHMSGYIPWMAEASKIRGLHEQRDVARLKGWFDSAVSWIDPREIPWCGAFVATCYRKWDRRIDIPENPLGAREWGKFGRICPPVFGACLTFWRGSKSGWKGHVGFYHGEDSTHYHVLGGNQSNAVTIARIEKGRLLQSRWPLDYGLIGKPIFLDAAGVPVTTNEA